jgi:hypothetical protein
VAAVAVAEVAEAVAAVDNCYISQLTKFIWYKKEYLNRLSYIENIWIETEKSQYVVIHPNDSKCAITALNLEKLKF